MNGGFGSQLACGQASRVVGAEEGRGHTLYCGSAEHYSLRTGCSERMGCTRVSCAGMAARESSRGSTECQIWQSWCWCQH